MKPYSGSKKKSLAAKKIVLPTKCSDAITISTLIESQGIKCFPFASCIEEKLSGLNKRQGTIAEKRIKYVLFELEMSVNESIDQNTQSFQNIKLFQIQYTNFQNHPIYQNPYHVVNVTHTTTGGSSSSTYTTTPTRGNTESYMDFPNSSKCNEICSYHMIYKIFLIL